jgi:hypothetical protein
MLGMDFGACCIKNDYIPSLLICIIGGGGNFDGGEEGLLGWGYLCGMGYINIRLMR